MYKMVYLIWARKLDRLWVLRTPSQDPASKILNKINISCYTELQALYVLRLLKLTILLQIFFIITPFLFLGLNFLIATRRNGLPKNYPFCNGYLITTWNGLSVISLLALLSGWQQYPKVLLMHWSHIYQLRWGAAIFRIIYKYYHTALITFKCNCHKFLSPWV